MSKKVSEKRYKVTFLPENKSIYIFKGETIFDASMNAGIFLNSECGGVGTCGRCKVLLKSGQVEKVQSELLSSEDKERGYVLACQTYPKSDLVIEVPVIEIGEAVIQEGLLAEDILKLEITEKVLAGIKRLDIRDVKILPRVVKKLITVEAPLIGRSSSDKYRLEIALKQQLGLEDCFIPLEILKKIPDVLRKGNWMITVTVDEISKDLIDIEPGNTTEESYGLAIDVGTTTVVVYLVNLNNGKILTSASEYNKQIRAGEDVISRIVYSLKGAGLEVLQGLIVETINELIVEVCKRTSVNPEKIHSIVCAGNTIMTHFLHGVSPKYLREEPYVPVANIFSPVSSKEIFLEHTPKAVVRSAPSVASYVGGDISAGLLISKVAEQEKLTLFLDMGTNGELVIGNSQWMVSTSCSAGPAFEGGGVKDGMRAIKGAIEAVKINPKTLKSSIKVIGGLKPKGICGSAMIDLLGQLYITGIINRKGKFNTDLNSPYVVIDKANPYYIIAKAEETATKKDIVISEVDLDNLIRAKGAVYAGITTLLEEVGLTKDNLEQIFIAGGFGHFINVRNAIIIGMLPDLPEEIFTFLGNTSVAGAHLALINRDKWKEMEKISRNITYIELFNNNKFYERYVASLFLPYTHIEEFPSVKKILKERGLCIQE